MNEITFNGRQVPGFALSAPQGLGATTVTTTSPAKVGLAAAAGGVLGAMLGGVVGMMVTDVSTPPATANRNIGIASLVGMLGGSFTGAYVAAPTVQQQG